MRSPVVWADAIAAVSDEYKNATVSLIDPSLITSTSFDVDTNNIVRVGDPVVAADIAARVQPIRLAVDQRAAQTGNPSGEVRMRVQIPRTSYAGKIRRGWQVRVTASDRNPELENYLIVVDAVVDSSWRASITIEGMVNVENNVLPFTPTAITGRVTNSHPHNIAGATVRAFYLEDGVWLFALAASADSSGHYALSGTDPARTYVVVASKTGYITQYYNNAFDFVTATPVAHNATGVDFELVPV